VAVRLPEGLSRPPPGGALRLLVLALVVGFLLTAPIGATGSRSEAPGNPAGTVDSPADGAAVAGSVTVVGWAVDAAAGGGEGAGVERVRIFVDGAYQGDAEHGTVRPDVAAAYGARFAGAGWAYHLDLAALDLGPHSIEAVVRSTVSGEEAVYARRVNVAPNAVAGAGAAAPAPAAPGGAAGATTPVRRARPGQPLFGVNAHLLWAGLDRAATDLGRLHDRGLNAVRLDVNWDELEPQAQGAWNPEYLHRLDGVMGLIRWYGLHPIVVVVGTPGWARGGAGSRMTPPSRPADFAAALGFLAGRYAGGPGVAYEVWNEPNQPQFWDAPGGPNAPAYARLLKPAYAAIKAADPTATVLGGSIAFNDWRYLKSLYAEGDVLGSMDGLAIHPYAQGQPPEARTDGYHSFALAVEQLGQVMAAHGDETTPLWITEMGWSTTLVDDVTRADYFRRAVGLVKGWSRVAAFCAYAYSQEDDYPDLGLIAPDGSATASWTAYTQAARG
jgi:hypothetical protein